MSTQLILQMPLHLLSIVLSYLDSALTLGSAILSYSSLYAAFKENPDRIMSDILTSQISPETMIYALAAYEVRSIYGTSLRQIEKFLCERLDFDRPQAIRRYCIRPGELDPSVAGTLSRTHTIIQYFAQDFVRDTLPLTRGQLSLERSDCSRASTSEIFRIHRALYRFQLYCSLCRRGENWLLPSPVRRSRFRLLLDEYILLTLGK